MAIVERMGEDEDARLTGATNLLSAVKIVPCMVEFSTVALPDVSEMSVEKVYVRAMVGANDALNQLATCLVVRTECAHSITIRPKEQQHQAQRPSRTRCPQHK